MNLRELVEAAFNNCSYGKDVDLMVKTWVPNFQDDSPFLPINTGDISRVRKMTIDSQSVFFYLANQAVNLCAYFSYDEVCPVGRMYFCTVKLFNIGSIQSEFKQIGIDISLISDDEFGRIVGIDDYKKRLELYRTQNVSSLACFKQLHDGRKESTIVQKSIVFKSKGCLLCEEHEARMMSSSLCADKGVCFMFTLCAKCEDEAKKAPSFIEFIMQAIGMQPSFQTDTLEWIDIFNEAADTLENDLNCEVIEKNYKRRTVKGRRKSSGFEVIFRLTSVTNYGYMIFNRMNVEVARFDSADHHKVNFGPDHLHPDLPLKTVKSSFTTGIPRIDISAIKRTLEEKEKGASK